MNFNDKTGKRKFDFSIFIYLIMFILVSVSVFAVPNSLNIQGKLTNTNNQIQTGTFNFTFRLYDAYTSGNMLYEKANLTATTDTRGVYDIILTDINISFDKQLYLGIEVNADGEMSPRINLTSVPYTFRANISDELDVNRSYAVLGLNVTENLTIGDKITFKLREAIDNLVDGFLRVTGSLNVTQDLIVLGGVNVSGDLKINQLVNITAVGDLYIAGGIKAGGGLNISGDLSIAQQINLTALGNIDASGTISAGTLNAISALNVGGGFDLGGLTIQNDGDIVTQGDILFTGNITIINVTHLSVNGSIIPALDNTFDVGNESLRWRSIYAAGMNLTSNNLELLGNLNVDSGTLFVDAALNRVGIGTAIPSSALQVIGNVNVSQNISVGNSIKDLDNDPRITFDGDVLVINLQD